MRSRMRSADRHGAFPARVGQDDREFVAAEPGHDVGFAGAAADDAGRLDQRLAARQMAVAVVDLLEAVQVEEQQRQRPAAARGALGFAAQHQVQVAGVVEPREVVGHRQRLGLLQRQRVVERDGRRLEQRPQRRHERRAERRGRGRRHRIEADERADRPVAADERKRDRRPGAPASAARVLRRGRRQTNSTPWRITQFAAAHSDGLEAGRQSLVGQHAELSVHVVRDHRPAGRRNPVVGLRDQPVGDLLRVERRVGLADGLDQRVAPLDARAQRPQTRLRRAAKSRRVGTASHARARRQAWWRSVSPLARRAERWTWRAAACR